MAEIASAENDSFQPRNFCLAAVVGEKAAAYAQSAVDETAKEAGPPKRASSAQICKKTSAVVAPLQPAKSHSHIADLPHPDTQAHGML